MSHILSLNIASLVLSVVAATMFLSSSLIFGHYADKLKKGFIFLGLGILINSLHSTIELLHAYKILDYEKLILMMPSLFIMSSLCIIYGAYLILKTTRDHLVIN